MAEESKRGVIILRRKQVQARTGLPSSTLYDKLNPKSPRYDPSFPTQIRLSASTVGWIESEVEAWIESRIRASRS
jgi:prophage regulatory protein